MDADCGQSFTARKQGESESIEPRPTQILIVKVNRIDRPTTVKVNRIDRAATYPACKEQQRFVFFLRMARERATAVSAHGFQKARACLLRYSKG